METTNLDKTSEKKSKRGRRPFSLSKKKRDECAHLVSFGWFSYGELIEYLGIGKTAFYNYLNNNPEFRVQLEKAKLEQKAGMMSKMAELALDGNIAALRWRLAVCHGLVEKQTVVHETDPLVQKIANMKPEEIDRRYKELIEKGMKNDQNKKQD